jgi:AraC-like DNA-binding protein/mannose-6-phosphate isomerase-like protein (cupin superfamily)
MSDWIAKNWVKTQSFPHLEGVRTHAANFVAERNVPRHVHQEYVFGLAIEGAMEIDCGHCGETHIIEPNDLMLTEAHEVYSSRALGLPPWQFFSISVSKEKLGLLLDSDGGGEITLPHFTRGAVKNNKLRGMFLKLHDSLNKERTALEQESLLSDWVTSVSEIYSDKQNIFHRKIYSESDAIRRVREFIRENSHENIKLQNLAQIARLSPFHLNRAFRAQVGLPPHEFQNQLRIEKAANLIAQKKSLAEIAFETGFADQSHFNRFFKRYMGVTPKRFVAR